MDVFAERKMLGEKHYQKIWDSMDKDTKKKVSAILNILEIGDTSIAGAKWMLHVCEATLESCSGCFCSNRNEEKR